MQLSMFRLGTLGAFFHVLLLFATVILSYFDCRRSTMLIYLFFLGTNILFTVISLDYGFQYYGYGYFLSALLSFALSVFVLFQHTRKLPYHAFITNNVSIQSEIKTLGA